MLKRLFGIGKKQGAQPPKDGSTPQRAAQLYGKPITAYQNYFNVHLYRVSVTDAVTLVREHYLHHVVSGTPAAVLLQDGNWVTVVFPEAVVKGLAFNRIAAQVAQELNTWVIGYRIFAWQGMDVHYFQGSAHIDQLAYTRNEIEFEPEQSILFSSIADVSALVPRPANMHPLDFHFALLNALGISNAAVTWEDAHALGGRTVSA